MTASSSKVGGLNVKFYDGSKEQHAKTSEYLDNLLAKYGKAPGATSPKSGAYPYAQAAAAYSPPLPQASSSVAAALYEQHHDQQQQHYQQMLQPSAAYAQQMQQQQQQQPLPGSYMQPGAQMMMMQQYPPQQLMFQQQQQIPSPYGYGAPHQQMSPHGSVYGMMPPGQQPGPNQGSGYAPAAAATAGGFNPGMPNPSGGFGYDADGNFKMVDRLRQLDELRTNIMQGVRPYSDGSFEEGSLGSSFVPSQVTIPTVPTPPHLHSPAPEPASATAAAPHPALQQQLQHVPPPSAATALAAVAAPLGSAPAAASSKPPQRPRSRVRGGGGSAFTSATTSAVNSAQPSVAPSPLPSRPQSAKGTGPNNIFAQQNAAVAKDGVPLPASPAGKTRPRRGGSSRATSRATSAAPSPLPSRPMSPVAETSENRSHQWREEDSSGPQEPQVQNDQEMDASLMAEPCDGAEAEDTAAEATGDLQGHPGQEESKEHDVGYQQQLQQMDHLGGETIGGTPLHTLVEGEEEGEEAMSSSHPSQNMMHSDAALMGTMNSDTPLMGTVNLAEMTSRTGSNADNKSSRSHSRTPSDAPLMATMASDVPLMGTVTLDEALVQENAEDDVPLQGTVTMDGGMPVVGEDEVGSSAVLDDVEAMIREMDQASSRNESTAEEGSPDAPAGEPAPPGGFGSAFGSGRFRGLHVVLPEDEEEEGRVAAAAGGAAADVVDAGGIEARLAGILSESDRPDESTADPSRDHDEEPGTPGREDSEDRARLVSLEGADEYAGEREDAPLQASPHPMMLWAQEALEPLPEEPGEAESGEQEALALAQAAADEEIAQIEARAAAAEEEARLQEEQSYRDWEESEKAKYMADYRMFLRSRNNTPTSSARGSVFRDTVSTLSELEKQHHEPQEKWIEPGYPEPNGRWASRPPRKKPVYTPSLYLGTHGRAHHRPASGSSSSRGRSSPAGNHGDTVSSPATAVSPSPMGRRRLDSAPVKRATSPSQRARLPPRPHSGVATNRRGEVLSPERSRVEGRPARNTSRQTGEVLRDLFKDEPAPLFAVTLSRAPRAKPQRRPISATDPRRVAADRAGIGAKEMKKLDRMSRAQVASRRCASACSNQTGPAKRRQQFDLTPEPSREISGALGEMTLEEAVRDMEERVGSTISVLEERKESARGNNLRFGKAFSQFLGADNLDEVLLGPGLPPKPSSVQQQHYSGQSRAGSARSKNSNIAIPTTTAAKETTTWAESSGGARPRSARPRSAVRPESASTRPKVRADSAKASTRSGTKDAAATVDIRRKPRPQSARPLKSKKEPAVTSDESKRIENAMNKLVAERIILQEESRRRGLKHQDPDREARRKAEEARIDADMKELEELKQEMLREAAGEAAAPAERGVSASGSKSSSRRSSVPTTRIMDKISRKWELDQDRRGRYNAIEAWDVELEPSTLRAVRKATGDGVAEADAGTYAAIKMDGESSSSRPRHTWWGGIAEYEEDGPPITSSDKPKRPTSSSQHKTDEEPRPAETAAQKPPKFNKAHLVKAPKDRQTAAAGAPEGTSSSRLRSAGIQPDSCWRDE